jgi:hypothetical protein
MRLALVTLLAVAGCGGDGGARPSVGGGAPTVERPVWQVRGRGGLAVIEPGTRDLDLIDAAACQGCHPAEHAEWAASRHGKAWVNGIFRREYRELPRKWCVRCHAPLAPQFDQVMAGGGPLADQGVSCAACHVRGGALVARRRRPGSPHATIESADFGSPEFCADCHQFEFPLIERGEVVGLSRHPMQDTVAEFRAGRFAGIPGGCRACHADSPAGHAYAGAHDPAMLERAIGVALCRRGDALVVALDNRGAGHAVPTGDVHRHIYARVWRSSAPEGLFEIFLGRRYDGEAATGKRTVWDSRLSPGERREHAVALAALGGEADEPINLELVYVYTGDERPLRHRDPGEPTRRIIADDRLELAAVSPCAER